MISPELTSPALASLLGRPFTDPLVQRLLRLPNAQFEEIGENAYIGLLDDGISFAFREQRGIQALVACHLHRSGHERYVQYQSSLPGGLAFSDPEAVVREKLGPPSQAGGGGRNDVLGIPLPRWMKFSVAGRLVHVQFDDVGTLEMVTLLDGGTPR